jgi:Rap1a immunity proteins
MTAKISRGKKSMKPSSLMPAAACIAMLSVTGHAEERAASANDVMKGCHAFIKKSDSDAFLKGVCAGVAHALSGIAWTREVCVPSGVTVRQEVRVVAAYIDARPARLHEDFRQLALEALKDAWPCDD